MNMNIARGLQ